MKFEWSECEWDYPGSPVRHLREFLVKVVPMSNLDQDIVGSEKLQLLVGEQILRRYISISVPDSETGMRQGNTYASICAFRCLSVSSSSISLDC